MIDITGLREDKRPQSSTIVHALLDRLEAAESARRDDYQNWMTALDRNAELIAKLEAAEKERDELRARIEQMERQEPFDAEGDVFRSAFEAALKAGNWPATRQGDGYRSPSTQIAWRIAFSTVNRMKLYRAPGAQPEPIIPEGWKPVPIEVIYLYSIMCAAFVPMTPQQEEIALQLDLAKRAMLAVAPEAKP